MIVKNRGYQEASAKLLAKQQQPVHFLMTIESICDCKEQRIKKLVLSCLLS